MTYHITDVELVGNWPSHLVQVALGPLAQSIDMANLSFHVKQLPESPMVPVTKERTFWCKMDTQMAAIDNGPLVTKEGVRRGNNSLAHRHIKVSRMNAQRPRMVSHSKLLLDKASAKKEKALAIPEQVHAMIRKSRELEASISKKLTKGHDASNLVKCLSVLQNRVRFLLDHCEEKEIRL